MSNCPSMLSRSPAHNELRAYPSYFNSKAQLPLLECSCSLHVIPDPTIYPVPYGKFFCTSDLTVYYFLSNTRNESQGTSTIEQEASHQAEHPISPYSLQLGMSGPAAQQDTPRPMSHWKQVSTKDEGHTTPLLRG